jgi:hypothetical protein
MKRNTGGVKAWIVLGFVLFFSNMQLTHAQSTKNSLIHQTLIPSLSSERFLANTRIKRNGLVVNPLTVKDKTNWNEENFEIIYENDSIKWNLIDSEKQRFQVIFPNDYSLYFGKDKKVLQEELVASFRKLPKSVEKSGVQTKNDTVKPNIQQTKYGIFFDQYFTNQFNEPIYSQNLIAESLVNSFTLENQPQFFTPLTVKFHKYGNEVEQFEIYPKSLLHILTQNGGYTSWSSLEDDFLIVLFEHPFLNFHHMLYVNKQKAGLPITADLYSYIPNSNIQELYGEFRKSKDRMKVLLDN